MSETKNSLNGFIKKRTDVAKIYDAHLKDLPLILPSTIPNSKSSFHLYTIRFKKGDRKKIFNQLRKSKIGVNVHYIPVVLHPFYKKLGFNLKNFPSCLAFYKNSMSIPIFPDLKKKTQLIIIKCIKKLI